MHITEDFLPNLMKLIKKTTWGNILSVCETLMLNERKIGQIVQQSLHEIAKKILI